MKNWFDKLGLFGKLAVGASTSVVPVGVSGYAIGATSSTETVKKAERWEKMCNKTNNKVGKLVIAPLGFLLEGFQSDIWSECIKQK